MNLASITLKGLHSLMSLGHQECPFQCLQCVTKVGVTFTAGQEQLTSHLLQFYVASVIAKPQFYVPGRGEGIRFRLFDCFIISQ